MARALLCALRTLRMKTYLELFIVVLVLAFGTRARAEPTEPTESERDFARDHYEQGIELARSGRYEEALQEFLLAYDKSPNYVVLYNVGQAYIGLKRPLEALAALERYVREGGDEIPPERLERTKKQIAAQRAEIGELRILVDVAGATIELDGAPLGKAPLLEPVRVMAGTHLIGVHAPDQPPLLRSVTVAPGQALDLAIELPQASEPITPAHPAPPAGAPPHDDSSAARASDVSRRTTSSTPVALGYVLTGAGTVLGGVAIGHYWWNRKRDASWQAEDTALHAERVSGDRDARQQANNELAHSIDRAEPVTVTLALSAGACLAAGVSLLVLHLGGASVEPALAAEATGVRFGARGTW
jgi:tetratricopeptide (TPR) repeat protein